MNDEGTKDSRYQWKGISNVLRERLVAGIVELCRCMRRLRRTSIKS